MIQMKITECNDDLLIIKRLKQSLLKKFRLGSPNDIDKAVILANFLFALDREEEAIDLLDSFIYEIESDPERRDVWGSNGQGIILRAYINQQASKPFEKLVKTIDEDDYWTDEINRYKLYLGSLHDHNWNMDQAKTETQKYRTEILGQEALTYMYFLMMLPFDKHKVPPDHKDNLKAIIDDCYSKLKEALLNPKLERIPIEEFEEKYKNHMPYEDS